MTTPDLRPLSLGELLDRTFNYYRRHFWVFVGIMAIPQVFLVMVGLLSEGMQSMARTTQPPSAAALGTIIGFGVLMLVMVVVYYVIYTMALGAITFAVSEAYLGRAITIGGAYQKMRGQVGKVIGLGLSIALRAFGWAITIILSPLAIRVFLQYALATPALLLEKISSSDARKRSRELTKGNFNRIALIGILMMIVTYAAVLIFQGPFYVPVAVLASKQVAAPYWLRALMHISGGMAGAFTAPLVMIALVFLYYDVRVRKEGYDLQVLMASLDQGPPRAGLSAATPPVAS